MIADGDSTARQAFRVALATASHETPLPLANATQELDPDDVLEVRDMAEAIARAEKIVSAPRSSGRGLVDMFESLGREKNNEKNNDDAIGPAVPYIAGAPTPIPARYIELPSACLVPPIPPAPTPTIGPAIAPPPPASSSNVATEDDAYFQPAGRMRSFADVTLDGYRPEPTMLVRAATRRRHFSWILAAALVPLIALAVYAVIAHRQATAEAALSTPQIQPLTSTANLVVTTTVASPAPPAPPPATAAPTPSPALPPFAPLTPPVPVFDVKNLPKAGKRAR